MPIIDFHGKKAIQNYEPPYHILEEIPELNYQSPIQGNSQDNILIEGDNLLALKSLLPEYEGKIKCIYIDPPYNTNNKDWVYCDNIEITSKNDPAWQQVEKFLKDGNEVDYNDQSRHSKWLCMMYPRLKLLHRLLKDDGVIFVSIDDNEVHHLRMIMDEIWGEQNFMTSVMWKRKKEISNDSKNFATQGEYILIYGKSNNSKIKLEQLSEEYLSKSYYEPTDEFPDGRWRPVPITVSKGLTGGGYTYEISTPSGKTHKKLWAYPENSYQELLESGRVYFGKKNDAIPQRVAYEGESEGKPVSNYWDNVTTNKEGKKQVLEVFGDNIFDTPKPVELIEKIISMVCEKGEVILDSFAGSGATAQGALKSKTKFITIQLPEVIKEKDSKGKISKAYQAGYKFVHEITRERIKRVAGGYTNSKGEQVEGLGGGFKYYRIGTPLFTKKGGDIVSTVTWEQLAPYIYFTEFKTPLVDKTELSKPKVGSKDKTELYLLYKEPQTNTLTEDLIIELNKQSKAKKVIYADKLEFGLDDDFLKDNGIIFKQIPYDVLSI